ncbi:MAG: glycerophosphodiester phosphodiesterase [Candidatus Omnitrophica bacterium]|nr:glycerophosphodiester phosphodiesterase [Candidatus Omnitrophota bacterium]
MSRRRILIIAHRGASAVAPEGTRAAIREAARAGARMVELDVQMTRDGRLVVFHDERLERTTNGAGRVREARFRALARLDAGSWFHPRFAGERILLVSQALRLAPARLRINLELKRTTRRAALLRRLVRVIRRARAGRRVLCSSFDPALLRPLRSQRVALALLCREEPDRSLRQAIQLRCAAWHPLHTLATAARITRAHAAGLRVHAWTVDEPARARRLARRGVDGLFTNDPRRIRRGLGGRG